jgi:hypothetical protein
MMAEDKIGHLVKLPLDAINEAVEAEPRVAYSEAEIAEVLADLHNAVDKKLMFHKHQQQKIQHCQMIMFLILMTKI